jgi:hypothetical protein
MKARSYTSLVLSAGLGLGIAILGNPARADESSAPQESAAQQQQVADSTLKLEGAFSDQFAHGKIDRSALAQPISDVLAAMPESARPKVKVHIEHVLQAAEKLSPQLTPEQRAAVVAPPETEKVGKTQQAQLATWGWPGAMGWGGYGAFGFPAMYSLGWGAGWPGWGYGLGTGYGAYGAYGASSAYSTSSYSSYGTSYGLGLGGLGWGGLGWGGWGW